MSANALLALLGDPLKGSDGEGDSDAGDPGERSMMAAKKACKAARDDNPKAFLQAVRVICMDCMDEGDDYADDTDTD